MVSLFFVIGTMIEFAIVLCINQIKDTNDTNTNQRGIPFFDDVSYASKNITLEENKTMGQNKTLIGKLKSYSTTKNWLVCIITLGFSIYYI